MVAESNRDTGKTSRGFQILVHRCHRALPGGDGPVNSTSDFGQRDDSCQWPDRHCGCKGAWTGMALKEVSSRAVANAAMGRRSRRRRPGDRLDPTGASRLRDGMFGTCGREVTRQYLDDFSSPG